MAKGNIEAYQTAHLSGAGGNAVAASDGILGGIFLNSGTTVTATTYDGHDATGRLMHNAALLAPGWNPMPCGFGAGLFVVLGGTTPDVTVHYLS